MFENPESYIAGLFDGGGNIYFRISKSNRDLGYRINPTVIIHIHKSDELYGFLDEILVENQIQFKISSTETGSKRIEIDTRDNISRFLELVNEETIQHSASLKFILNHLFPTRDSGDILNKKAFVKMVATIESLQPRRVSNQNVKYSSDYFHQKWNIDQEISPISMQNTTNDRSVSLEYLTGFFDGSGNIRPVIHESKSTEIGYSISLRVGMTRSWIRDSTIDKITDRLNEMEVSYNVNEHGSRIGLHITEHGSIEQFLTNIQPLLISNFEISMLTTDKILPAFRDNYHKTRQGIYDIVALYEIVMEEKQERKYTAGYFKRQWETVDPLRISPTDN